MPKKVFISFLRSPVGSAYHVEGLRFALGILGGDEEHEITLAHMGKGVRAALRGVDRSYAEGFLDMLPKDGSGHLFLVERESLEKEGISESELDSSFAVAPRDELREKMLQADATFSF